MRSPSRSARAHAPALAGALAGLVLAAPSGAPAQAPPEDPTRLVEDARRRQRDFERFRQSRIPVEPERSGGGCDQRIGRICIWFGGEGEADFPPEPPETARARRELIAALARAAEAAADPWLVGQLVHYLVEDGGAERAEAVARRCGIADAWWCSALLGYTLHVREDFVAAEAAFRDAVASMPEKEREGWTSPRYIFERGREKDFDRAGPEERERRWELFWLLSDPLFLVEGNDRLTDHFARWVEARNHRDAEHPQAMSWDEDMEETLIRYGRIVGWSRTHSPRAGFGGFGRIQVRDTRRVVGHHHPRSRGYLFPETFLESPSDVPPESWITAPREARTWYAPPYAPDFRGLETQVGRFRRGEEMLVVGAYRPSSSGEVDFAGGARGAVRAGLFLVSVDGGAGAEARGTESRGTFTLRARPGRYVASLEVLEAGERRAWRARQGVSQSPLVPGLAAVSDLMILERGAPLPESLDEAIGHVRPGVRLARGERFTVVWEVYGLRVREPATVTIGFTRGRPGFLARVGDFLGVIEPDRPVEVTFEETFADRVQAAFRAVALELPDLEPGEYTLHLRLDLRGREPVIASRPIVVEGRGR